MQRNRGIQGNLFVEIRVPALHSDNGSYNVQKLAPLGRFRYIPNGLDVKGSRHVHLWL
jgi:hypothetical protein